MVDYIPLIPLRVVFNNRSFDIGVQYSNISSITHSLDSDNKIDESTSYLRFDKGVIIDPTCGTCSNCRIKKPVAEVLSYIDHHIRESQISLMAELQKRRLQIT